MQIFDVLNPEVVINKHLLLEASAGCGKTFAIEHLVVRRLLEPIEEGHYVCMKEIAVVTFTRAAARELKVRIRLCLHNAVQALNRGVLLPNDPQYIQAIFAQGEEATRWSRWIVQEALAQFEECTILTIHGFCQKVLAEFFLTHHFSMEGEKWFSKSGLMKLIHDVMRTHIDEDFLHVNQLLILLEAYAYDSSSLIRAIEKGLSREGVGDKSLGLNLSVMMHFFEQKVEWMRNEKGWNKQTIYNNLCHLSALYKQCQDKKGDIYPHLDKSFKAFSQCFEDPSNKEWMGNLIRSPLYFSRVFQEKKVRANKEKQRQVDPDFLTICEQHFEPIISLLASSDFLLARLVRHASQLIDQWLVNKGSYLPDLLLQQMHKAIRVPSFCEKIKQTFSYVLIDEFQDTDPLQWDIFDTLFLVGGDWKGYICLIGDPKQSIYAFRKADIYTYIRAKNTLGKQAVARLNTNFRSSYALVKAINTLFCGPELKTLFSLPKNQDYIECYPVEYGGQVKNSEDVAGKKALHFIAARACARAHKKWPSIELEEQVLFPFIVRELLELYQAGIPFSRCAILVKDRFQLERVKKFLCECSIPAVSTRGSFLPNCEAICILKRLIAAVRSPTDRSVVLCYLLSNPICLTYREYTDLMQNTNSLDLWAGWVYSFKKLRQYFEKGGFSLFFQEWLGTSWDVTGMTIKEKMVLSSEGDETYRDLEHIFEIIIAHQYQWNGSFDCLEKFLFNIEKECSDEELNLIPRYDVDKEAITLLTMHKSKGLQYDVVFALGVASRTLERQEINVDAWESCLTNDRCLPSCSEMDEEIEAEKLRQFYVATTRARLRLYIPVLIDTSGQQVDYGVASPIELYLAHIALARNSSSRQEQNCTNFYSLYQYLDASSQSHALEIVAARTDTISVSYEENMTRAIANCFSQKKITLTPPTAVSFSSYSRKFDSFTHSKITGDGLWRLGVEQIKEDLVVEREEIPPVMTISQKVLPLGIETGIILHELLASMVVDPSKIKMGVHSLQEWVTPYIRMTALQGREETVAQMLYQAFHCSLVCPSGEIQLQNVDWLRSFQEMEFLFFHEAKQQHKNIEEKYFRGVIDLIFEAHGAYWILDWKTNWLGSERTDYHATALKKAVYEHRYDVQARIYAEAFSRYIKKFSKGNKVYRLGGVYFLFLRGIDLESRPGEGSFLFLADQLTFNLSSRLSIKIEDFDLSLR